MLSRRNAVGILLSVELMVNAVNINLVAFSRVQGTAAGQVFALFAIAITVAEVVVGLALVILLYRAPSRRTRGRRERAQGLTHETRLRSSWRWSRC